MFGLLRTLVSLHVCGSGSPHLAPVFELSTGLLQAPQRLRSPALALCVCLPCILSSGEAKIALPSLLMKQRAGDLIPVIASLSYPRKEVIPKAMVILESSNAS